MSLLLDDEYFHFGTDILYKELWGKIQMIHKSNYTKPIGGLWTSPVNSYYLCDWLRYREFRDRYNFDLFVANQKSSLVKFKSDAKLLNISTENDFKNLKDSGFVITLDEHIKLYTCDKPIFELPDYEKISEYFGNENVDRSNLGYTYLDNENNIVIVGLIDNSIEKQDEFINHVFLKLWRKIY